MSVKCFVLRLAQSKSPQLSLYILSQWEQRFEDEIESGLEKRKQSNRGKAYNKHEIRSVNKGAGGLKEIL